MRENVKFETCVAFLQIWAQIGNKKYIHTIDVLLPIIILKSIKVPSIKIINIREFFSNVNFVYSLCYK